MNINRSLVIVVTVLLRFFVLNEGRRVKRVIGGMEVKCGTQPRIASLRNSTSEQHLCGATILTPHFAITAAHCVRYGPEQYYLQMNNYCYEGMIPTAGVLEVIQYELYDRDSRAHDVALLRIHVDLDDITWLNDTVLPNSSFGVSGDCVIFGYGSKSADSTATSEVLLAAKLRIVSLDKCTEILGPVSPSSNDGMMCAVGDGIDACQGDSGSPLMCNSQIQGICSYGLSCGVRGVPGVYTSIGGHLQWIREVISTIAT